MNSVGLLNKMNALPLKPQVTPHGEIDRLIADYGLRRILLALAGRLFRRSRPPDKPKSRGRVDVIPPYLRKDLGLPPEPPPRIMIDLTHLNRGRFY